MMILRSIGMLPIRHLASFCLAVTATGLMAPAKAASAPGNYVIEEVEAKAASSSKHKVFPASAPAQPKQGKSFIQPETPASATSRTSSRSCRIVIPTTAFPRAASPTATANTPTPTSITSTRSRSASSPAAPAFTGFPITPISATSRTGSLSGSAKPTTFAGISPAAPAPKPPSTTTMKTRSTARICSRARRARS